MISYCWKDQEVARKVARHLSNNGFNVWIDIHRMRDDINQAMLDAIQSSRVIVPFISEAYIDSRNCKLEMYYAHEQNKKFLPIQLSASPKVLDSAAYYFTAGMLYVDLGPKVWEDSSARSKAIKNIVAYLTDQCEMTNFSRNMKSKTTWGIILGAVLGIVLVIVAIVLGLHFANA
ncbi:hypothetical protein HK405_002856, partial [Cladochytrium tenue]